MLWRTVIVGYVLVACLGKASTCFAQNQEVNIEFDVTYVTYNEKGGRVVKREPSNVHRTVYFLGSNVLLRLSNKEKGLEFPRGGGSSEFADERWRYRGTMQSDRRRFAFHAQWGSVARHSTGWVEWEERYVFSLSNGACQLETALFRVADQSISSRLYYHQVEDIKNVTCVLSALKQ